MSPEAVTKPRWLWRFGKTLRPPDLRVPNQGRRGEPGPPFFAAYGEWMGTPPPTWEDIAWLRELWGGPFMLKGVMRVDDAKRAVDAGVSAISVSNHGGNNLDGTPAVDPRPARGRRRGRRPGRGVAGRRHPAGQRRRQGGGAGRPRGDDRPGVPVGPGRGRPSRRRERARHPARRHRLGADGSRASRRSTTSTPDDILVPDGFTRALGVPTPIRLMPSVGTPTLVQAWQTMLT